MSNTVHFLLTFPYFKLLVWRDIIPSPPIFCISAYCIKYNTIKYNTHHVIVKISHAIYIFNYKPLTLIKSYSQNKDRICNWSSYVRILWTPPGKLTDANCNTASYEILIPTTYIILEEETFWPPISHFHLLDSTAAILPITKSPTSPKYLGQ